MQEEYNALVANNTWELIFLLKRHKAIPSKWIFHVKLHVDEKLDKYKSRVVVNFFPKNLV